MPVSTPPDLQVSFNAKFAAGDLDGLLDLYEDEAVFVDAEGAAHRGRTAISGQLQALLGIPNVSFVLEGVYEAEVGGTALLHGVWTLNGNTPDGAPLELAGVSNEFARRQDDGTWRYVIDNPFGFPPAARAS